MRRKILTALLTTLAAAACALGLAACKTDPTDSQSPSGQTSSSDISAPADSSAPQWGDVYTVEAAYEKASELGYAGSLEEFIQMISGKDGQDGVDGKDGIDGKDGADGKDGMDGRGIREVSVNQKGELVIAFTDGTSVTLDLDCPHRYSEWMIIAEPNCTSLGVRTRRCEICGDTEYDFSKSTGHVWGDGFVLSEPTCTEDGQALRVCEQCGVMKLQALEAKGHRYENCVCTVCGEIDVENMFVFTPTEKGTYAVALADDLKPTITSVVIPSEYASTRVTEIANSAFANCSNLAAIDIPDTVEKIGESAFFASGIESVVIPDTVTEIGSYAFANCENLAEVSLGDRVEVIGDSAFRDTALTHVVFPESVREIRSNAFSGCTALKYITFADHSPALKKIESFAFTDCAIEEVWLPLDATEVAENAFDDGVTIHIMQGDENLFFSRFTLEDGSEAYKVNARNKKTITEIIIPSFYNGLPVAMIASQGFSFCENLVSVTIPDSVTKIDNNGFSNCTKLVSVTIPDSVTEIGHSTFMRCQSLKSLTIPKSVTKIGRLLFVHCTALEALSVEEGNPVYHSDGNCIIETATKTLVYGCKTSVIPDDGSVTKIGERAFFLSSVESIVIPAPVTEIGYHAFDRSENLAEVSLGSSVEIIEESAFLSTALTHVVFPTSIREIRSNAFSGCTALKYITFSDNAPDLEKIEFYAFRGCAIEEVWLPEGDDIQIDAYAFEDTVTIHRGHDENLTFSRFTLADGSPAYQVKARKKDITEAIIPAVYNGLPVARIADNGFVWCEKLVSVTIPDSVTEIGNHAFMRCHSLKSITVPKSVTKIGDFTFAMCQSLKSITIPDSITEIGNNAFAVCQSLKSIIIPKSVTKIGNYIFVSCTSLEALSVEEGNPVYHSDGNCIIETATKILVYGCKTSVIPDDGSVTKIGDKAFINCTTLVSVTIPAPVTEIGDNAFAKCENLAEVTLSEGLKTIGENAFWGCTALKEIELPASAEEIAESAFDSDTNVIFKEKEEAA